MKSCLPAGHGKRREYQTTPTFALSVNTLSHAPQRRQPVGRSKRSALICGICGPPISFVFICVHLWFLFWREGGDRGNDYGRRLRGDDLGEGFLLLTAEGMALTLGATKGITI